MIYYLFAFSAILTSFLLFFGYFELLLPVGFPPPMHSFVRLLLFLHFYNRTRRKKVFGYFIRLHFLFARSLFTIMYSVLYSVNFCFSCLSWTSILARRTGTNVFFHILRGLIPWIYVRMYLFIIFHQPDIHITEKKGKKRLSYRKES